VREVAVQLGIEMRLEDVVERRLLAFLFGLERFRVVEYQPLTPMRRAFSPGAMIVLISVCPVFMSLPASGAFVCCASSTSAGMSALRFGAAFAYGMPSRMAAYA